MIDAGEAARKAVLNVANWSGLAPLARPLLGGLGAILMLHSVTAHPRHASGFNEHLIITPDFLDSLIVTMKKDGYVFVSMDEAVERLKLGKGDRRFAAITLDDGYRDNLVEALPIFERHATPCMIYVAPAQIDGTIDLWWEVLEEIVQLRDIIYINTPGGRVTLDCSTFRKKGESLNKLHEYLTIDVAETEQQGILREIGKDAGVDIETMQRGRLLSWDDIRSLAAHPLVTIGAHTVSHHNLARLSEEEARREIREAARIIESELGAAPRHMSYPYGYPSAVGKREVALAKEAGFVSAVTTRHGVLHGSHAQHLTALPRISINGRYQRLNHVRTMLSGITTPLANGGRIVATV